MRIKEDFSYLNDLDKILIERGLAKRGVYQFRLDRYLTDEQKEENRKYAEKVGNPSEEWKSYCLEIAMNVANSNGKVMQELEKHFIIGQWKYESRNHYDLWFWCNCKYNRGYSTETINDWCLDYITLGLNEPKRIELFDEHMKLVDRIVNVLNTIDTSNNIAIIQYTAIYDNEKIDELLSNVYSKIVDKFVKNTDYKNEEIKIYKFMDRYCYKIKRGRTMYNLDKLHFIEIALANNLI